MSIKTDSVSILANEIIFSQGDPSNAIFQIRSGRVKITCLSEIGKEATLGILSACDFFGEGCLTSQTVRSHTATALSDCEIIRIKKDDMASTLLEDPSFSKMFMAYLLARNIRYEEDLVDQLFNSSEKRLARVLLL